jgi:hypothetical protein
VPAGSIKARHESIFGRNRFAKIEPRTRVEVLDAGKRTSDKLAPILADDNSTWAALDYWTPHNDVRLTRTV